jgi:pimeloyl-ACP methyl ester carboxylesterase
MDRRQVIGASAGALAATMLEACMRHTAVVATEPSHAIDAATFHRMRRFAETRFGRIAYVERGHGKAALFLHGYPLNGFQWRGALERLSPYRRCIAPDLMGLGYSEIPERQSVAPEAQAEMLAALLDALSITSVDLVGCDSGGAVAQLFTTRFSSRVRTLLLTNCDAQDDCPPPSFLPFIAQARAGRLADGIAAQLAKKDLARSPRGIGGLTYSDPTHPTDDAIEVYFAPIVSSPLRKAQFHDYAIALERNVLAGIEPALKQVAAPVRIVWGMADTTFASSSASWFDRTFPHSRGVRRIEGAKLFFAEEMPDVIAEEARALWDR